MGYAPEEWWRCPCGVYNWIKYSICASCGKHR